MKVAIDHTIHEAALGLLEPRTDAYVTNFAQREAHVYEADAIIVRTSTTVDKDFINSMPNLRYIATATTGLNHIDTAYAQQKGIEVFNAKGANADSVADLVLRSIMKATDDWSYTTQHLRIGNNYDFAATKKANQRRELGSFSIGIIGYGNVGQRVAQRALAFGMTVRSYDPYVDTAKDSLDEVLTQSDFVTLHPELTEETHGMIGMNALNKMKRGSYLINMARGEIVNEDALLHHLKYGHNIKGAILDVFLNEPEPHPEFRTLPNAHITPHIAGNAMEAKKRAAVMVAEQLISRL